MPFMYCDPPSLVEHITPATGPAWVQAGHVTLKSGANFEFTLSAGLEPDSPFIVKLRKTDRLQLCYAPKQHWADAGPDARMAIVGDLDDGEYTYTLAYPSPR